MGDNLDLSGAFEKLQDMLSTSDGQEQIQGMLSAFMNNDTEAGNSEKAICDDNNNNQGNILSGLSGGGGINPEMLFKIQRIMSIMNSSKPEVGVEFLRCLKPLLKESRREKIDKAVKIITLIKVMETLKKEGGI